MMTGGTRSLGLFSAPHLPPRDRKGRWVRVRHSPERIRILNQTAKLRAELGMAPAPALCIHGRDD